MSYNIKKGRINLIKEISIASIPIAFDFTDIIALNVSIDIVVTFSNENSSVVTL